MTDAPDVELDVSAKRRKVRKGTQSCWECKRRKIRCTFASSEDVTCIGCQRRRATCVSQEMPEELSPAKKGTRHLSERIAKVEGLMNNFLSNKDVAPSNHTEGEPQQDKWLVSDALRARSTESASSSIRAPPTPTEVRESSILTLDVP